MITETETTGSRLWRLSMKWRAAVDRAVAPYGLTHAQYVVLASLYGLSRTGARPSQRELADHTGLEPVYVSRLARALEQAELINRVEAAADPRAVELSLTSRGIERIVPAIATVRDLHATLLAPLGGPDTARTLAFNDGLRTLLQDHQEGASRL